jgi:hypothetical protein
MSQLGQVHWLQATVIQLVQNISGLNANINLEALCICSPEVTMQIENAITWINQKKYLTQSVKYNQPLMGPSNSGAPGSHMKCGGLKN